VWLARRFMSDADYHRTVEQGLLFGKMMEKHSAVEEKGEQVKARHILVSTEQEAKDLYNKLRQGTDFVALARQFSLDTASAPNGGDLDWVFRGQTDENFEKALFALKPGEFSGPIKSELGWHLLKSEAKEVRQLPIDLIQQRKQEAFSNYIKDLRDKAKIEILLK
jgi:foldase protein PrsA